MLLVSSLALGANRPSAWLLLGAAALGLLVVQLLLDALQPPRSALSQAIAFPAAAMLAVLAWAFLQRTPGWAPEGWWHPAWALTEVPGVIAIRPIAAEHHIVRLASYAALFWIAVRAAAERRRAAAMVATIAVFSSALALYGLATWALAVNPILEAAGWQRPQVTASFVNQNSYVLHAAFGLLANIAAWIVAMEGATGPVHLRTARQIGRDLLESFVRRGWIYAVGALLCGLAIALTLSRGGAAAAFLGTVTFLLLYGRKRGVVGRVAAAGVGLGVVVVASTSMSGLARRLLATTEEEGRFVIFETLIEASSDRLWLGHGLGGFRDAFRLHVPAEFARSDWDLAHNAYLENVFELGLPAALALFAALTAVGIRVARATATRRRDHVFAALAGAALVAGAIHSLVDFSLQMPANAALLAFLLGIGWAQSFPSAGGEPVARSTSRRGPV